MNIKDYISSGIVEAYVLGLADEAERIGFEKICAEYPEVESAKNAFETLMEQNAVLTAIDPPKHLKSKIFEAIKNEEDNRLSPVIPITTSDGRATRRNISGISRYMTAAALILLVVSTAFNFYLFRQYKDYSSKYVNLLASNQLIAKENININVRLQAYESAMDLMKNPDIAVVQMPASTVPTSPDPSSLAVVYWNTRTKDVYLLFNKMPRAAADKQYQLWAIVDGKPVDAGLVDNNFDNPLIKMKNISRAEVFAVTLEKRGGSTSPQGQMYVLGNVKT